MIRVLLCFWFDRLLLLIVLSNCRVHSGFWIMNHTSIFLWNIALCLNSFFIVFYFVYLLLLLSKVSFFFQLSDSELWNFYSKKSFSIAHYWGVNIFIQISNSLSRLKQQGVAGNFPAFSNQIWPFYNQRCLFPTQNGTESLFTHRERILFHLAVSDLFKL